MSANHNQKLSQAIEIIKAVKKSGADAIKLQTYTADTITIDSDKENFKVKGGLWDGYYLYELYKKASTPWEWHSELFRIAKEEGLVCFSTPFDHTAVDFLESLDNPIYKIASFEITDVSLIRYAASKGKPMIISTGVAEVEDIILAIDACKSVGNDQITLLKCTSQYPARIEDANLMTIPDMKLRFNTEVGVSDHTLGSLVPTLAVTLGATVVEKHFTLDRKLGGVDSSFSMEPNEFKEMVQTVRLTQAALGNVKYDVSNKDKNKRRSLYVVKDMNAGDNFTNENVRSIRPGYGMHPKYLEMILGKKAKVDLDKGTALEIDHVFL